MIQCAGLATSTQSNIFILPNDVSPPICHCGTLSATELTQLSEFIPERGDFTVYMSRTVVEQNRPNSMILNLYANMIIKIVSLFRAT